MCAAAVGFSARAVPQVFLISVFLSPDILMPVKELNNDLKASLTADR